MNFVKERIVFMGRESEKDINEMFICSMKSPEETLDFSDEDYEKLIEALFLVEDFVDALIAGVEIVKNTANRETIVFWGDGSFTCVKASENTAMDDYAAFTAAFTKRLIGNNTRIRKIVTLTNEIRPQSKFVIKQHLLQKNKECLEV